MRGGGFYLFLGGLSAIAAIGGAVGLAAHTSDPVLGVIVVCANLALAIFCWRYR